MRPSARLVRPDVAVILPIRRTHTDGFVDLDQHAAEKAVLLQYLAPGGLAILVGDDPRVARMADRTRFRSCLVGTSPSFDLWGDQVSGCWPKGLSFQAHWGQETCEVRTQLLGSHWVSSVLAALAAAVHAGVPLKDAARVLPHISPYTARLEPVALPGGAVIIRDDHLADIDGFMAALQVLREARTQRRVLVTSARFRHAEGDFRFPARGTSARRPSASQGRHHGPCRAAVLRSGRKRVLLARTLPQARALRRLLGAGLTPNAGYVPPSLGQQV